MQGINYYIIRRDLYSMVTDVKQHLLQHISNAWARFHTEELQLYAPFELRCCLYTASYGFSRYSDEVELRHGGNNTFERGTETLSIGEFYEHCMRSPTYRNQVLTASQKKTANGRVTIPLLLFIFDWKVR